MTLTYIHNRIELFSIFNFTETFVERFGIDFRKFQEMLVYYVLVEAAAIRFLIGEASVVKGRS